MLRCIDLRIMVQPRLQLLYSLHAAHTHAQQPQLGKHTQLCAVFFLALLHYAGTNAAMHT